MDSVKDIDPNLNWYSVDRGATWDEHYAFWEDANTVGHNMLRAIVEPGSYEFLCSVPGHAQAGMTGTLLVE